MPSTIDLDPNAVLDIAFDWSAWLATSETIATHTATVTGATKDASAESSGVVTVWVSSATANGTVLCHITTNQGRADDRTMTFTVKQR